MPENKTFKEESQLSEYISFLLVAYVEVNLLDVEVRLFLAKITLYNFSSIKPFFGIMDEYPLLQKLDIFCRNWSYKSGQCKVGGLKPCL